MAAPFFSKWRRLTTIISRPPETRKWILNISGTGTLKVWRWCPSYGTYRWVKKTVIINVYIFLLYIYTFIMCQLLISKLVRCLYTPRVAMPHVDFYSMFFFLIVIFLLCSRQKAWKKKSWTQSKNFETQYTPLIDGGRLHTYVLPPSVLFFWTQSTLLHVW